MKGNSEMTFKEYKDHMRKLAEAAAGIIKEEDLPEEIKMRVIEKLIDLIEAKEE